MWINVHVHTCVCVRVFLGGRACVRACMCAYDSVRYTVAHGRQLKVLIYRNKIVTLYYSFSLADLPASSFSTESEASTNIVGGCRVRLSPYDNSGGPNRGNCKIHGYVCLVHNVTNTLLLRFG